MHSGDKMKKCKTCYGFGLWVWGAPSPMGPMDAQDGTPTKACPECGANANPMKVAKPPKTKKFSAKEIAQAWELARVWTKVVDEYLAQAKEMEKTWKILEPLMMEASKSRRKKK